MSLREVLQRIAIGQARGEWQIRTWNNAGVFRFLGVLALALAWIIGSRLSALLGMGLTFMVVQAIFTRPKKK